MQVSKWGNSLAVRLPAAVVEALDLQRDRRTFARRRNAQRGLVSTAQRSFAPNSIAKPASAPVEVR